MQKTARATAEFLVRPDGPRVAVFETTGWDTHANQAMRLGRLLKGLDDGLASLRQELGAHWANTVVLVLTEFGRSAAFNGTGGTDHGTGAAAFLLGGAVAGGRVHADWPGLAASALHQGRDLRPTLDLRAVMKGVLADHLGVPAGALDRDVFPDSSAVRPLRDLMRA